MLRATVLLAAPSAITLAIIAGCATSADEPAARDENELPTDIRKRVIEIASEYRNYPRVSDSPGWAPGLCIGPPSGGALVSAAVDDTPHGRKLYYLHALSPGAYRGVNMERSEPSDPAPIGQVLVKEAWAPVETGAPAPSESGYGLAPDHAAHDGVVYRTGEHAGLFVMLKVDPATPGTDRGWVYATIAPDLRTTTSLGRVESCMKCHVHAKHDRQFGLPHDWTRARIMPDKRVP